MPTLERLALVVAIFVIGNFLIARAHDDAVIHQQFACVERGGAGIDSAATDASEAWARVYAGCGVVEKKLLYSERVWGNNKLVQPLLRDDFRDFLWSLLAAAP